MRTKLRYSTRAQFTPTGTTVQQFQLRGNGLFDPQVALGGHQPRGFDEFMKTYDMYTVHGSKCSGSFMYEGYLGPAKVSTTGNRIQSITDGMTDQTPALTPVVCGLHKGVETLSTGTSEDQIEKDRTVWSFINGQQGHKTLSTSMKVSDFYGKGALTGSEGYTGTAGTDPDNEVFYEFWCGFPAEYRGAEMLLDVQVAPRPRAPWPRFQQRQDRPPPGLPLADCAPRVVAPRRLVPAASRTSCSVQRAGAQVAHDLGQHACVLDVLPELPELLRRPARGLCD
jgi:hypothetical protein